MFTVTRRKAPAQRERELVGRTIVVIGGTAGVGLEIARSARGDGADVITAAFDADDQAALERFFGGLPGPIDDVVVAAGGPHALAVARNAVAKMRPGGTLLLMDGTGGPQLTAALAVALAPVRVRVKLIAPGLVDTSLSDDLTALAVHAKANTPPTGATEDIDGRQLVAEAV